MPYYTVGSGWGGREEKRNGVGNRAYKYLI